MDEADRVKTDGSYFYIATDKGVRIVNFQTPMQVVGSIDIDGIIGELHLYKQVLAVLYTPWDGQGHPWSVVDRPPGGGGLGDTLAGLPYRLPVKVRSGVALIDVSDPASPMMIRAEEVDGYLVSSRRIEEKLHLVQQFLPDLPPIRYWYDEQTALIDDIVAGNRNLLDKVPLSSLVPAYRTVFPGSGSDVEKQAVMPEHFYRPADGGSGGSIATVVTFDLDRPEEPFTSAALIADANAVYASTKALYLFSGEWQTGAKVEQRTAIHKLNLNGERARPAGAGRVNGWILNQFSAGEHEGVLRVATTTTSWDAGSTRSGNHVYCLEESDGDLRIVGKLENLAPGETLYSSRFIGRRGFLVTFERIDPLFTLDLSDPSTPRMMGELKVPGYSDYIHPWGQDHLITLGKMVTEDQYGNLYQRGINLSVFDISDIQQPVLVDALEIGGRGSISEALWTHKAFTFRQDDEGGLLTLPIDLYESDPSSGEPWAWGRYISSGLYVYRLSATPDNAFDLLGVVSTHRGGDDQTWGPAWTRGIFGETQVWAVTPTAVHTARIADIEGTIQTVDLSTD
ncbi:MAG: hypothetical protein CR984_04085 [Proteobacteria bacterium]|nr:MAG: hypothetical protein CR984_04085 [Pseudomonadota bacterium]